jgi:hypothetical protein
MVAWWHAWRIPILSTLGFVVVLTVAYVTGSISWRHIVHVGHMVEEPSAGLLPVAVDGMMLTGAIMAWIDRMRGYRARAWSIVALWLGSLLTVCFNALSALERGWQAVGLAMVPAIAFLVTVESVFHPSQRLLEMVREAVSVPVIESPAPQPETPAVQPKPATTGNGSRPSRPRKSHGPKPEGPRRAPRQANHTARIVTGEELDRAAKEFREQKATPPAMVVTPTFREPSAVDSDPIDAEIVESVYGPSTQESVAVSERGTVPS